MRTILFIFLLSCIGVANAQLQLNAEKSSLHFISIKNNSTGEVLTFDQLNGSVSENGTAVLEIDLASVNTKVETRDERMKKSLFDVTNFPVATITTQIDMKKIKKLDVGKEISMELKGAVALHGEQSNVFATVLVSKNYAGEIRVTTTHPILVNARHFKLIQGIGILRKQAGLTVISSVVPVSFSLVFK
jgi:polyisoprenoid-binding protein YceI